MTDIVSDTDIVERLRREQDKTGPLFGPLFGEAASEIERLRAEARLMRATAVPRDEYELLRGEIERLRAALREIVAFDASPYSDSGADRHVNSTRAIARAALGEPA